MRSDLQAKAQFRRIGTAMELKMSARVLNLATSMPENSDDLYVKHRNKSKRGYPNLKREIKAITDDEREALAQVVTDFLVAAFQGVDADKAKMASMSSPVGV